MTMCTECFLKKRNRTLDRHTFFARMQQSGSSIHQFQHARNKLAAPCEFGEITTTLVQDMFILQMNKKTVI